MGKIFRFFLLILLAPMICAFAYEAYLFLRANITLQEIAWLAGGFGVYLLIYVLFLKESITFWETLEHELGHAIALLAVLQKPKKLEVDAEKGGEVKSEGKGCVLATLAPYFLPVFTLPLLPIALIAPAPLDQVFDSLIGATLGFHIVGVYRDLQQKQSDFKKVGGIFSFFVMGILNVVFFVVILGFVTKDLGSVGGYFKNSFMRTFDWYKAIVQAVRAVDLPSLDELRQKLPGG